MTQEQKKQITEMRKQNLGYAYIAKELDISLNTVKAFCRRNDLTGNRSATDTQSENISVSSQKVDLIRADSRVNSTTAKQPRTLENTGLSDGQPICEVTVSYRKCACPANRSHRAGYPFTSKPASRSHRNRQAVHIDAGYSFTSTRVNGLLVRLVHIENCTLSARENAPSPGKKGKKKKP